VPLRLWQKGVTPGAGDVPQLEVRLSYPLIEAELVNQPGALIVDVAQSRTRVPPQLRNAFGWSSYAVAALTLAGRTIGTLHADATRSERRMDELDREVVAFLADGLTCAYEVAVLRQRLKRHRALQHAAIKQMAGSLDSPDSQTSRSRREIIIDPLSDPMTPRERDVLELLARGLTNQSISRELLISEATVKHHVKHVLRKLGAANRTDAVSRYLQISGADRADA
jgi:DNA-binding CsgD family transcriptional regulator